MSPAKPNPASEAAARPAAASRRRGFAGRLFVAAACGLLVGAVAVVAVVVDRLTPVPVTATDPVPVVLPVTSSTVEQQTSVALKVLFDAPGKVVIRGTGVLTDLEVEPGTPLTDGLLIAKLDDKPVVAMVSPAALYRGLGPGDRGPDVQRLQEWLRRHQFLAAKPDGRFGPLTRQAVRNWQRSLGLTPTGVFDPAPLAWIGPEDTAVDELQSTAGQNMSEGDVLFTTRAAVRAIEVAEPPGGIKQAGDLLLVVGDAEVPYQPGSGRIDDRNDATAIRAALGTTTEGIGRVRSATMQQVKLVPASAVVTDDAGKTCAFAAVAAPPTAVTPLGGGLGGVTVPVSFPLTTVLANPAEVRPELTCD